MDKVYMRALTGDPLPAPKSCPQATKLSDLLNLDVSVGADAEICAYNLGEALFLELYQALGDAPFRQGFGTLFTYLNDEALHVRCINAEDKALCYVHGAFIEALPDHATIAEEIINRHYYGSS